MDRVIASMHDILNYINHRGIVILNCILSSIKKIYLIFFVYDTNLKYTR